MKEKEITFPSKPNEKIAELIGIIIEDGNIYFNLKKKKYYFEITGNPHYELEYFNYINSQLIYFILNKTGTIKKRGRGLRLRVYSKCFINYLIFTLGLPHSKNKCLNVRIPVEIKNSSWNILKKTIRGITDTDGSLFFSNKGYREDYPSIEICTISKGLAYDVFNILKRNNFNPRIRSYLQNKMKYTIGMYGDKLAKKWMKEVGSSNSYKANKFKRFGPEGI